MNTTLTENNKLTIDHLRWLGLTIKDGAFVRKGLEGEIQYKDGSFYYCVDNTAIKKLLINKDADDLIMPIANAEIQERNAALRL